MFTKTKLHVVFNIEAIITLHYFEYARDFHFSGETHDFWEMVYVDFGEVGVVAGDTGYVLQQGEAYFHKPNEYHSIWSNNTFSGVTIITFECNSPSMKLFDGKLLRLNDTQKQHIAEILEHGSRTFKEPLNIVDQSRMLLSSDAPFGSLQLIKSHMEQLLIDMVQCGMSLPKKQRISKDHLHKHKEDPIVTKIKEILNNNLCGHISLDDIATQSGYSKSYIKTVFKNSTGFSIIQMFLRMKIDHSKKLISEQAYSITEISEMLGFNSIHYFSRVFKNITGISPTQYSHSVRRKALL